MSEDVLLPATDVDQTEEAKEASALEALVGEGKKFSDYEGLAKGKLAGDQHIEKLEAENAELRANLEKRLTAEEILSEIKNSQKVEAEHGNHSVVEETTTSSQDLGVNDIVNLVDQRMTEKSQREIAEANRVKANKELVQRLGDVDTAKKYLEAKAVELGVSADWLVDTAEKSPDAFIKILDVPSAPASRELPEGSVNTDSGLLSNDQGNLKAHYQKMRRENPDLYYSSRIQNEIMKAGMEGKY